MAIACSFRSPARSVNYVEVDSKLHEGVHSSRMTTVDASRYQAIYTPCAAHARGTPGARLYEEECPKKKLKVDFLRGE